MATETPPESPLTAQDMTPDPITPGLEVPSLSEALRTYIFDRRGSSSFVLLQYDDAPDVNLAIEPFIKHAIDSGWTVSHIDS